ncbi:Cellulase M-related protein [Rubrobacter radiotolerans]|uniref:Cellulase M-related protein n=1 Tax=Rubrobacter radiotolerans TaxID=42256 RepID=A0A023X4N6_RUBRA|nr:M42 family metallopeptidase [Rubrobacter radiotolerans]AHY47432.1 Cellulase M-related protein [Rubrobacter radiotolerans]MDX5894835.1 M42 family metallopeptidase [Rubrobacter radiotolerans]SMC06870.1 endoglucanase [Rubrobacter radiotolerans DSM 5868]
MRDASLKFFKTLLSTPGPSGYEAAVAEVWREEARSFADEVRGDRMGNSFATVGKGGTPRVMLSGHIDEIGLIVTHIDEKGLLYFKGVGGWDSQVLVGQRVKVQTANGEVPGVIGKKAIHLMSVEERKKVSQIKDLWIDVGAKDGEEAKGLVRIGDVAVLDQDVLELPNGRIASRSIDNRMGAFVVLEALRLLSEEEDLNAEVIASASVQEEIGLNGARGAAFGLDPDAAIAVDVTHATDTPGISKSENGDHAFGSGPVITRGSTLSPLVTGGLIETAEREGIPHTLEADANRTGTDADAIHLSRAGIATAVVSCPNRYMHSPSEMVQLDDVENCARLIAAYVKSLPKDADFVR